MAASAGEFPAQGWAEERTTVLQFPGPDASPGSSQRPLEEGGNSGVGFARSRTPGSTRRRSGQLHPKSVSLLGLPKAVFAATALGIFFITLVSVRFFFCMEASTLPSATRRGLSFGSTSRKLAAAGGPALLHSGPEEDHDWEAMERRATNCLIAVQPALPSDKRSPLLSPISSVRRRHRNLQYAFRALVTTAWLVVLSVVVLAVYQATGDPFISSATAAGGLLLPVAGLLWFYMANRERREYTRLP